MLGLSVPTEAEAATTGRAARQTNTDVTAGLRPTARLFSTRCPSSIRSHTEWRSDGIASTFSGGICTMRRRA